MKIPKIAIPIVIIVLAFMTLPIKELFNVPAVEATFGNGSSVAEASTKKVTLTITNLTCRGKSAFFVSRFEGKEGILNIATYPTDREAVIDYDSSKINLEQIKEIANEPIQGRDGQFHQFFKVEKVR